MDKKRKKNTSHRIPAKKTCFLSNVYLKKQPHGESKGTIPHPQSTPHPGAQVSQVALGRFQTWKQNQTEGWNLLEEIRKGVSEEALVSQVAEAVQRCRHGRCCEGHYNYIYIYIYVIYSLVMSCSYVIVVSLMSLIYVYLCPVCHLCQSLIVWFLETSRNIMLMFMLDAQKKHV